jgi:hypothetical protein
MLILASEIMTTCMEKLPITHDFHNKCQKPPSLPHTPPSL